MSADLIRDYLALPERTALDQFIVKDESDSDALAAAYVFTANVRDRLDAFLGDVGRLFARGQDFQSLGRWVFGSFGSGKSHFLRVVGMMLAGEQRLYAINKDPALTALQGAHPWLVERKILVVRVSMMGKSPTQSLTTTLAREYDARLEALGQPRAEVLGYDRVFSNFDAYVARAPQLYDTFEDEKGYCRERFAAMRAGSFEQRRALARDCMSFMYPDDPTVRFEADPDVAREHMARHAKALGYDAVAFLIDEFVLWAQSLPGREYMAAVNELTGLVDAERRPLPFIVLAAIQRNIDEAFPDDDSEKNLRESLDHTQARFQPQIVLEDRDIYEIARRRVLAVQPGREAAWRERVNGVVRDLDRVKSVLVGSESPQTLAELYPFHPALMHVLSNVSQGLQRERTALFMLYQLLVEIRPELAVGQLMSLGALWEALYAPENVELLRQQVSRRSIGTAARVLIDSYDAWQRLVPEIASVAAGNDDDRRVLDLVVKSVLLCQMSTTRFFGDDRPLSQAITVENLVRLNRTEIGAPIERSAVSRVDRLCAALAAAAPSSVRVDGSGASAVAHIDLEAVDLGKVLTALRPNAGDRFETITRYAADVLDIERRLGNELSGTLPVTWRQTARRGRVRLDRLEQLSLHGTASALVPEANEAFRIVVLVDVADQVVAIDRIVAARENAQQWTAVVVPARLSGEGREALELLAKIERVFPRDRERALYEYRPGEHAAVLRQLDATRAGAERRFREALALAYGRDAQLLSLQRSAPDLLTGGERDPATLVERMAIQLLDLRYPAHPRFAETPRPPTLATLVAIIVRAARENGRTALVNDDENLRVERLGVPLDFVDHGAAVASLRPTGTYVSAARDAVVGGETSVAGLRKVLGERYGLTNDVADAVLAVLAIRDDYRLALDGKTRAVAALADLDAKGTLVKGTLPAQAAWIAGRAAAIELFGLGDVPNPLSPAAVETLLERLRSALPPVLAALRAARDTMAGLRTGGKLSGDSRPLERYEAAANALARLHDDQRVVDDLAQMTPPQRAQLTQAIAAAPKDTGALRDVAGAPMYAQVDADLRAELQTIVIGGDLPLAPQLTAWQKKADKWIGEVLAAKANSASDAPRPAGPEPAAAKGGQRDERPAPASARPARTIRLDARSSLAAALPDLEAAVADVRASYPGAVVELRVSAAGEDVS